VVLVCTGDTLFVNDVGRTDFGGPDKRREWSETLYNSIFKKLLPLGDHVIMCPAHGSGSVCGGGIADREWSTLGIERIMNPALQKSKKKFIELKVNEHHDYAPYFRMMEKYNIEGAPFVGYGPNPKSLTIKEFRDKIDDGSIVVDTRSPSAFGGAHIKNSYSIPTRRLSTAGWLISYDKSILLIVDDIADLDYAARSLLRIGYDKVEGYMELSSWFKSGYPLESSGLLTVNKLKERLDVGEEFVLLDVRSKDEWEKGRIKGVQNIYIGLLEARLGEVPDSLPIVVICKTGTRSSVGVSILLRGGRSRVYNLLGGMDAWNKAKYPMSK
jgi:hydroxyacylglutathione hydrolase